MQNEKIIHPYPGLKILEGCRIKCRRGKTSAYNEYMRAVTAYNEYISTHQSDPIAEKLDHIRTEDAASADSPADSPSDSSDDISAVTELKTPWMLRKAHTKQ